MKIDHLTHKIDFFKLLKNNTPFLIGIYTLSFINYYIYYKSFEIPIFNYLGFNDMLFFSLEYAFKIIAIIFLSEIFLFFVFGILYHFYVRGIILFVKKKYILYLSAKKRDKKRMTNPLEKQFIKKLNEFRITLLVLSIFILHFLGKTYISIPIFIIYWAYSLEKMEKKNLRNFTLIFFCGVTFLSLTIATIISAYNKRYYKDDYIISLKENLVEISTNRKTSNYNYLGETSSHIFFFDVKNKESRICSKSKVTEFKIQNKNSIDDHIKKIEKYNVFLILESLIRK